VHRLDPCAPHCTGGSQTRPYQQLFINRCWVEYYRLGMIISNCVRRYAVAALRADPRQRILRYPIRCPIHCAQGKAEGKAQDRLSNPNG
jgi:hypothetical protein